MSELAKVETNNTPAQILKPIASVAELIDAQKALVTFVNEVLEDDKDYGTIPGTDKKSLYKPGAERLCAGFGLVARYEIIEKEIDHGFSNIFTATKWVTMPDPGKETKDRIKAEGRGRNKKMPDGKWLWQVKEEETGIAAGLYRYVIRCQLSKGEHMIGEGVGSCSSLESKYMRAPHDAENTILKMAKKRAYVDATLTTLALSDRFTQDVEDIQDNSAARKTQSSQTASSQGEPIDAEYTVNPETPEEAQQRAESHRKGVFAAMREMNLPPHEGAAKVVYYQVFGKVVGRVLVSLSSLSADEWQTAHTWIEAVRAGERKMPKAFEEIIAAMNGTVTEPVAQAPAEHDPFADDEQPTLGEEVAA